MELCKLASNPLVRIAAVVFSLIYFLLPLLGADQIKCPAPVTHLSTPKGEYSPQSGVVFALSDFSADMVQLGKKSPLCFVRITDIRQGDIFVSSQSLSHEFQSKFEQSGESKITDFQVETKEHVVHLKGKMKKLIPISFTLEGPVSTDGNTLIFHATKIKADGLEIKGLLDVLGKHLGSLMQSESVNGVIVQGDTIVFRPEQIAHVRGHIVSADITRKGLFVRFAQAEPVKQAKK